MIYFTADQHFHHQNIIKHCDRPFAWYDQMDESIIENFNSIVTDDDVIYHLGDFAWGDDVWGYLSRLKGKEHHLLIGNHDNEQECRKYFTSVNKVLYLKGVNGTNVWLSHYAHRTWPESHFKSIHLFGHSHGHLRIEPEIRCCDVGVDAWKFKPVSLHNVLKYIKTH